MTYDFVILLSGNSYVSHVRKEDIPTIEAAIVAGLQTPTRLIKLEDGNRIAQIKPECIMGWFFRPHEKSVQERALDTLNKAIDPPEDSWKRDDE